MEYRVTAEEEGWRVWDVLRRRLRISYTALQSAKWSGRILLNGTPARANDRVRTGDTACFLPPLSSPAALPEPYPCPLRIVYQDEHLMVVDKPAPMASQCGRGHQGGTLENALFSWLGCPPDFIYRPVNRLDRGTSGLMVIAGDGHAQQLLQQMLHTPDFRRFYLAVTDGLPPQPSGVVDAPIAKEDSASVRRIISPSGRPNVTRYEVLRQDTQTRRALVRLELETGRTHQIRVHLASIGCPVFGDFLYGAESSLLPGRFALHSTAIELLHPLTGERISLVSPLPAALAALIP